MLKRHEDRTKSSHRVDTLAGRYLDTNNYRERDRSPSRRQTSTLSEMTVEGRVQSETRMSEGLMALCSGFTDPKQYDDHLRDLRAFVDASGGKDGEQLRKMLSVVLGYLYVDAWRRGAPKLAEALVDKYGDDLGGEERRVLRERVGGDECGRVEKVDVCLSCESAQSLVYFMGRMENVVLRNVVERCCDVRSCGGLSESCASCQTGANEPRKNETETETNCETTTKAKSHPESHSETHSETKTETVNQMCEDEESLLEGARTENDFVRRLRRTISQVYEIRESNALPSVCLHTFYNVSRLGLTNVVFSPDSSLLCGTFEDSSVRLWNRLGCVFRLSRNVDEKGLGLSHLSVNLPAALRLREIAMDSSNQQESDTLILRGHSSAVYSASFTHDGRYLLSASGDTSVRLWDIKKQCNVVLYKGHAWPVWDVSFSPVDYYFATASFDRTARLWRTDTTYPLRIFAGHTRGVNCVRFHPNCSYLATASADGTCRMWSAQTGQYVRLFSKHVAPVRAVAFSPDGKQLVSASDDRKVLLWDIATGNVIHEMTSHTDKVYTVDFSHDGLVLASSGEDGTIRLWNTKETGKELACFTAKSCIIQRIQFSKNNLILAAGVHSPHR